MPRPLTIAEQTETKLDYTRLDHLGIVAGVCDEIGLEQLINKLIPSAPQRKIKYGTAVKAMILNGLGFAHRTLYLTPDFFKDKPVEHLLGEGIAASDLHDDCLGDTLDALYKYGVNQLFFDISWEAHQKCDLAIKSKHLDGTTLTVQGKDTDSPDSPLRAVQGYNKQGRHHLAQVVLELITNGEGGIPLFMSVHDGNKVDKTLFVEVIKDYQQKLKAAGGAASDIWVADNSLYTSENITQLANTYWLTRPGHSLKWVKRAYCESEKGSWQAFETHQGYELQNIQLISQPYYKQGRRAKDAQPAGYRYSVAAKITKKQAAIAAKEASFGKFVLATNEIDTKQKGEKMLHRSPDEYLQKYKNDQQKTERAFRFLKDPLFLLDHFFVQLPHRIMALAMIMCLSLLIYTLAEFKLRDSLAKTNQTLPNQVGKQIKNPSMRWIFMAFRGIGILETTDNQQKLLLGLEAAHKQVLAHLGSKVAAYYGV